MEMDIGIEWTTLLHNVREKHKPTLCGREYFVYQDETQFRALPLGIWIFSRVDLPEQRLKSLGELVNIALPFLTPPPSLQSTVAQQPKAQAKDRPGYEE